MILNYKEWPHIAGMISLFRSRGIRNIEDLLDVPFSLERIGTGPGESVTIGVPRGSLRIISLTLQGFGLFRERTSIDFSDGINIITGRNGSGKSTLFGSIFWCLTGSTGTSDGWGEGSTAKDVVNWDLFPEKGWETRVDLEFYYGDRRYSASRTLSGEGMNFEIRSEDSQIPMNSLPPGLNVHTLPFIIFKGESLLFLSHEDPFSREGPLKRALLSMSGCTEIRKYIEILDGAKREMVESLGKRSKRSDPVESELRRIEEELKELERDENLSRMELERLAGSLKEAEESYRQAVREIGGGDGGRDLKDLMRKISRKELAGERIGSILAKAPAGILSKPLKKSVDFAENYREENTRKRVLYGIYQSQIDIVEEVMKRKRCICGTPVGTSGMGRRNLDGLKHRLISKRNSVSDWRNLPTGLSDSNLKKSRELLSVKWQGRNDFKKEIDAYRAGIKAEKIMYRMKDARDEDRSYLESVKKFERLKAERSVERINLSGIRSRIEGKRMELDRAENKLAEIWGEEGRGVYREKIRWISHCTDQGQHLMDKILEPYKNRLEEELNSVIDQMEVTDQSGNIRIEPDTFRMFRERIGGGRKTLIGMNNMSAGERESLAISLVLALSRIQEGPVMIDSPFQFMDSSRIENALEIIANEHGPTMISIPSGTISPDRFSAPGDKTDIQVMELSRSGNITEVARQEIGGV
mgnify:CR=1 FL=1